MGASLDNGLLHIDMRQKLPEGNARKIEIQSPAQSRSQSKSSNQKSKSGTKMAKSMGEDSHSDDSLVDPDDVHITRLS